MVLLVAQALATVAVALFAWRTAFSRGSGPLVAGVVLGVLGVLAQVAIFGGDAIGGTLAAYGGTGLCGVVFGLGFVLWLWAMGCAGLFAAGRMAAVGVLAALIVSRAAIMGLRPALSEDVLFTVGVACLDVSVVVLIGLLGWALRRHTVVGQPLAVRLRDQVPTLLGVGLFSMLFGLTTQVHNNAQGYSTVPDYLSSLLTLGVLAVLAVRVVACEKPLKVERFFIVTIPLIAAVMAGAPLLWASVSDMADALVKSFFNVYFAVLMVYVVQLVGARGAAPAEAPLRDPLVVPACALTVLWTCVAVGSMIGLAFMTIVEESTTAVTSAFLAATWVCVVAMVAQSRVARPERVVERVVPVPASVVYVDRTDEQIRRLGEQVGLSAREREVCALLVQGRSAARIGAELVLSENTVKTHLQNIYAKVGVHTKQELLDRVAAIEIRQPGE